jgi:hypothetical protein
MRSSKGKRKCYKPYAKRRPACACIYTSILTLSLSPYSVPPLVLILSFPLLHPSSERGQFVTQDPTDMFPNQLFPSLSDLSHPPLPPFRTESGGHGDSSLGVPYPTQNLLGRPTPLSPYTEGLSTSFLQGGESFPFVHQRFDLARYRIPDGYADLLSWTGKETEVFTGIGHDLFET